ncbi:MAG: hypothetical protein HC860_27555 [Alkalinema sp. RU_4_3]|nr:hypothetical protein [Alkalinema sp. RU_4_3]
MVQSIAAKEVTLAQLRESFGLQVLRDPQFFTEWIQPTVGLTSAEEQTLDRVKQNFESLMEDPPMFRQRSLILRMLSEIKDASKL